MNSLLTSFDYTGGWQDELQEGSPIGLFEYEPRSGFLSAQQTSTNPFHGQDITTTFSEYYGWNSLPQHYGHAPGGSPASNQHGSCSVPIYTAAQSHLIHDSNSSQSLNFDGGQSSFSDSEVDHCYQNCVQQISARTHSLPNLPGQWSSLSPSEYSQDPFSTNMVETTQATNNGSSLLSEQSLFHCTSRSRTSPAAQDLQPNDPSRHREQTARFDGDLYTPAFIRIEGKTRQGWCGYCASWHTLRDSAYWYHMHFQHGISCATGKRLPAPDHFRSTMGAARGVDDCEASCGGCGRWVLLVAGERGRTAWFRHAYKCQLKGSVGVGMSGRTRTKKSERGNSRSPRKVAVKLAQ